MLAMNSWLVGNLWTKNSLNKLRLINVFWTSQNGLTHGYHLSIFEVQLAVIIYIKISSTLLSIVITRTCQCLNWRHNSSAPKQLRAKTA